MSALTRFDLIVNARERAAQHAARYPLPAGQVVALSVIQYRVTCAWCQLVLEPGTPNAPTPHTVCPSCLTTHFPECA